MEKVLVLGATGGTGKALVQELMARGIATIAFGRNQGALEILAKELGNPKKLELALGDVFKWESIRDAAKTADIIFQAANVPYQEMAAKSLLLAESVMKAAEANSQKIVFVDGIYVYGPNPGYAVEESYPRKPNSKKGKIRIEMENLIFSDRWKQSKPLIVRLPDYYGPSSKNAYLNPTLEGLAFGKTALFIGDTSVKREYIYLPDAAKMIVNLASRESSYGRNWNVPGQVISAKEIVKIAKQTTGKRTFLIPVGKITLVLAGIFDSFLREVVEMMYLTKDPLVLSGAQYEREIGAIPKTPFEKGLKETFEFIQSNKR
ncbi:SDR family NAD(P)-dependent oxidoreductase [Leptospira sp. 201903074]|uniref:SDR family NAD(P)-dependent oxidoreductase n=1 Tax=Leptospira abararensis TaxID=2810036 RepID=UPI0019648A31|nr:SDR family NAD(P)-dependent oxidoreductase [Leptospira abararensis]MBM9546862.1 SDR family NAD(P)-dependent oxidoreductase [Leptospira abararensis]